MASKPLTVLNRRADFLKLIKFGQKVRPCDWMVINYSKNSDGIMRFGWTLPRFVGSAVVRNRLKRWCRVYFRSVVSTEAEIPIDINIVFRATEENFYKRLDYVQFSAVLDRGLQQIRRRSKS